MKRTFLVRSNPMDQKSKLVEVSGAEWYAITQKSNELLDDQKRYFIKDIIPDGDDLDVMQIEVSKKEYTAWRTQEKAKERNGQLVPEFEILSLDAEVKDAEVTSRHECVGDDRVCVEETAIDTILLTELRLALRRWKPWAEEMLQFYLNGEKRSCTGFIATKYQVSHQRVREYKRSFESFTKKFLAGVSF